MNVLIMNILRKKGIFERIYFNDFSLNSRKPDSSLLKVKSDFILAFFFQIKSCLLNILMLHQSLSPPALS